MLVCGYTVDYAAVVRGHVNKFGSFHGRMTFPCRWIQWPGGTIASHSSATFVRLIDAVPRSKNTSGYREYEGGKGSEDGDDVKDEHRLLQEEGLSRPDRFPRPKSVSAYSLKPIEYFSNISPTPTPLNRPPLLFLLPPLSSQTSRPSFVARVARVL